MAYICEYTGIGNKAVDNVSEMGADDDYAFAQNKLLSSPRYPDFIAAFDNLQDCNAERGHKTSDASAYLRIAKMSHMIQILEEIATGGDGHD
jgi:hypothetical protein